MLICFMRTTVDIPDDLLHRAKVCAAQRGITLEDVFAAGLQKELAADDESPRAKGMGRPVPVTIESRGWRFPFQTNAELFEAIERDEEA